MTLTNQPALTVLTNTPEQLDLRVIELTRGMVLIFGIVVLLLAGTFCALTGRFFLTVILFFITFHMITAFIFLVGVRRITADVPLNSLHVSYRSIMRKTQLSIRLSDVQKIAMLNSSPGSTASGGENGQEKHHLQAQFSDRNPVTLFEHSGPLGYCVGTIVLTWWQKKSRTS